MTDFNVGLDTVTDEELPDGGSISLSFPPCAGREEELLSEIDRLSGIIQSIQKQYNELMGVAEQYRDEARKWYQKYLSGRKP